MSCIRTPSKQTVNIIPPSETPPKPGVGKSLRRSLEKWEAAMAEPITSKASTQPVSTAKKLIPHKGKSPLNKITDINISPPIVSKCKTIVEEARALVAKAKTSISLVRNLKTQYKDTMLSSLDGLKTRGSFGGGPGGKEGQKGRGGHRGCGVGHGFTLARDPGLSARLEDHSRLLTENTCKMRELQEQLKGCRESLEAQQKTCAGVCYCSCLQTAAGRAQCTSLGGNNIEK
ncbi:unnamed protein product [Euphydryas editha]|uniref:Uncharacterized protein n=1 Tax=Euphydryas editha TaxID=104508 RepID=A0AAU9UAE5_EUPED|nr:unnamed protein product [Euphydryas editha]